MTKEAERLVLELREDADWAHANEWESPITLGDNLEEAANLIENLSEDLENDETQIEGLEIMLTTAQAAAETWQRRSEAAERDLGQMLPCVTCKHTIGEAETCYTCTAVGIGVIGWRMKNYAWRGPCAENGSTDGCGQVYLIQRQDGTERKDMISCETCSLYGKCGREQTDGLECCENWKNGGVK